MYRQKKVTYMCERAPQKHIFSGLKIHLHIQSMQFSSSVASSLLLGGGGGGARPPNVPTEKIMYM